MSEIKDIHAIIIGLHNSGLGITDISNLSGQTHEIVRRIVRKYEKDDQYIKKVYKYDPGKVKFYRPKPLEEINIKKRIIEYYNQAYTYDQIVEAMNDEENIFTTNRKKPISKCLVQYCIKQYKADNDYIDKIPIEK